MKKAIEYLHWSIANMAEAFEDITAALSSLLAQLDSIVWLHRQRVSEDKRRARKAIPPKIGKVHRGFAPHSRQRIHQRRG